MSRKTEKTEANGSLKDLVLAYRTLDLSIEEREKAFKESMKEDRLTLDFLETEVLAELQANGFSSIRIAKQDDIDPRCVGLLYTINSVRSKVEDAESFFNYVCDTRAIDLLQARASDKAVQEFVEMHKEPPPGIVVNETQKLGFRKS